MSMEAASIAQRCQTLRLGAIGAQFASLAEEARQQNHSHLHYLEALLQAEVEERERRSIELRVSEWPQVFTNARLCKAVLDRLTDRAHIIETGSESYRFRRTLRKKRKE